MLAGPCPDFFLKLDRYVYAGSNTLHLVLQIQAFMFLPLRATAAFADASCLDRAVVIGWVSILPVAAFLQERAAIDYKSPLLQAEDFFITLQRWRCLAEPVPAGQLPPV